MHTPTDHLTAAELLDLEEELWEEEDEEEEGGEEEDEDPPDDPPGDEEGEEGDDDPPLGPKGTKALEAEKQKRRDAQKQLREWKALGLSPADIRKLVDAQSGDEPDPDQIREQAKAEAKAEVMRDRIMDKIEAKAGSRFSLEPEDVAVLLMRRHDVDEFLDDGKLDVEAISDALDELLEASPNLAAQGGRRFQGGGDGGARNERRTKQLSRDDLKTMSPAQISEARQKGQLADLMAGKTT